MAKIVDMQGNPVFPSIKGQIIINIDPAMGEDDINLFIDEYLLQFLKDLEFPYEDVYYL